MQARGFKATFLALLFAAVPSTVPAAAQTKVEVIPDPLKLPAAEVAYVHPLWRPVDSPPKLIEIPKPTDIQANVTLYVTARVDTKGNVVDAAGVDPPLKGLNASLTFLAQKWRFAPAKKEGRPVVTWASLGFELSISVEKGVFTIFKLVPVEKEDPLQVPVREVSGDAWLKRYPKAISPPDSVAVSLEEVDFVPTPEKTKWDWDSTRLRSRISALVQVSSTGVVRKIVPTNPAQGYEAFIYTWLRAMAPKWKISPAMAKGRPVDSWMALEGSVEYTLDNAKDRSRRAIQKNLRAIPAD